jgi:uncharacterized protein YllA (UPF0747 family)
MRISLQHCPPASALFGDYLENWSRVQAFYAHPYSFSSIEQFARELTPLDPDHRQRLCQVLAEQQANWGAGQQGVQKLASGAVAVVTGQQPTLFTGPLFCVLKAISVIKIAQRLEKVGVTAVPMFWIAAEDHDYKEIEAAYVINRTSDLCEIRVDLSTGEPVPSGWLQFSDDVDNAVSQCLEHLPQSEFIPELKTILEDSYKPGVSPVTAFASMMARLFSGTDLTFIDPLHDGLRAIAKPIIQMAIGRNSEMRSALIARNKALSMAGYHEQVKVDENFTGLFGYRGRQRQPLRPSELGNGVSWSPNVLLRPIVQDVLLPTVTYIAGPSEVAYFAQAAAVYETLSRPMPPIFPRISATLIEPRIARLIEKYGLDWEDIFHGREHLRRKLVSATQDDTAFQRVSNTIEMELNSLRPLLSAVDETLTGALDTSRQKLLHQVESLHNKYVHAVLRRNETIERHLDSISNSLFPEKKQQERVLNITSFIGRYGLALIPRLMDSLSVDTQEHQVVEL